MKLITGGTGLLGSEILKLEQNSVGCPTLTIENSYKLILDFIDPTKCIFSRELPARLKKNLAENQNTRLKILLR